MLLRTLGGLRLDGSRFTRPKPLLLLTYLALEGPKDRRFLAEMLWSGASDPANGLATTLKRLRREVPGGIETDAARVWTPLRTDAHQLLAAVRRGDFERVEAEYGGPFLQGVPLPHAGTELEEWVFGTREFLARQMRSALLALAEGDAAAGRFEPAAQRAERALRVAGAPPPEASELVHLHDVMLAGGSPFAAVVRDEAAELGVDVAPSAVAARERLERSLGGDPAGDDAVGDREAFRARRLEQRIGFGTSSDGVRIAYATVGEGPVLVKAANWLSHLAFEWDSPVWRHWVEGLSRHHTLVRYDERGCGLSDWNVDDFSVDVWVRDLETVVEATGCERFPLIGISQGGAVAIAYAVRHPERVSHLVLYGAYARGRLKRIPSHLPIEELEEESETMRRLIRLGWGRDNPAFRQVFTTRFLPGGTIEQFRWFNDLQRVSTSPENAERFTSAFDVIDVLELAPRVSVPTLVLHARDDAAVPFEEGRLVASLIPGARFVPLDGQNHLLLEDEPAWRHFIDEVQRFMGAGAAARTPMAAS